MNAYVRLVGIAGIVAALGTALPAQTSTAIKFTETKLANGLRVIISEDHAAPVYSIVVHYLVGSKDERKGRTGFAHLFEHMMFKGSENVGPGEHFMQVFVNGGTMNGTTDKDRTLYYETLPSNQLDLGIFLEADRMRSLEITKDNLDNQRNAVQEERRLRLDNQPYGRAYEAVDELAYDNEAYAHSVIGSMADLNAASVEDVAGFFKTYYAPNNAVLAIVGDVDTKTTIEKVRKAFEPIPSQPPPPTVDLSEPKQTAERRARIDDPLARLARLDIVYKIPERFHADSDALQVLATVLASGRSSRFFQQIVREQQLATNVSAFRDAGIGPGLFRIVGTAVPGKSPNALERAIDAEIERVKSGPIVEWEIDKARNSAKRGVVQGLTSSLQRAVQLADFASYGDTSRINQRVDRIMKVTAEDVQRVARTYLAPTNRTVVLSEPRTAPTGAGGGR